VDGADVNDAGGFAKAKVNRRFERSEVELKLLDANPMQPTAGFKK